MSNQAGVTGGPASQNQPATVIAASTPPTSPLQSPTKTPKLSSPKYLLDPTAEQIAHLKSFRHFIMVKYELPKNSTELNVDALAFPTDYERFIANVRHFLCYVFRFGPPRGLDELAIREPLFDHLWEFRMSLFYWGSRHYCRDSPAYRKHYGHSVTEIMSWLHKNGFEQGRKYIPGLIPQFEPAGTNPTTTNGLEKGIELTREEIEKCGPLKDREARMREAI